MERRRMCPLHQPHRAQAGMPFRADDDVIVDRDAQALARLDDVAGQLDIGAAGGGVAARVIVDHAKQYYKCLFFQT